MHTVYVIRIINGKKKFQHKENKAVQTMSNNFWCKSDMNTDIVVQQIQKVVLCYNFSKQCNIWAQTPGRICQEILLDSRKLSRHENQRDSWEMWPSVFLKK